MKKRTSIHDIARHLKVSSTAISFVLNGKAREKGISQDLEKRIMDYVNEIGYQPNLVAKSLRTGKSYLIAMLVESIADPFFSNIAKVVEAEAYKLGYKVFFASTENEADKAKVLINIFRDRQVDGYIIAPPPGIESDVASLQAADKPVIFFDRYLEGLPTRNVMVDNYEGGYHAVKHLIDNGFKKIGCVTLESEQTQMKERLASYQKALADAGLPERVKSISFNLTEEQIISEIQNWLQTENGAMDAVFFATSYLTLGGLEAIKNLGIIIPDELAVVGFDDSTYFKLNKPSITVIAQPIEEIAKQTVKLLMEDITAKTPVKPDAENPIAVKLQTDLIIRESSSQKKG